MIWLVGNKGMLGADLEAALREHSYEYVASDSEVDICQIEGLRAFLNKKTDGSLTGIINCSAYTAVDKAEDETELSFRINRDGVLNLSRVAKENKAFLMHISTDYVFNGMKEGAYTEDDSVDPCGIYGKSKLAGEECIKKTMDEYFILRTSWLYGRNNKNFVYTMVKLFRRLDVLKVVEDQWGSPTYTKDLASAIMVILKHVNSNPGDRRYGTYHFANKGRTNWYRFACEIYKEAIALKLINKDVKLSGIKTEEYPTKAVRPANSYLSKEKIINNFGINIREWPLALHEFLSGDASEEEMG